MRASTAAGINNSLLPRKRSCEGFPDGAFAGGAVRGRDLFSWRLLDFR